MTDREMLELSARAAGTDLSEAFWGGGRDGFYWVASGPWPYIKYWNPLVDDGDALRLAVKLDMIDGREWKAPITGAIFDECDGDWLAATRRAIVRAAAELGKRAAGEE